MNFVELEAFAALARNLHFAKAAAAVNMSPSALSRMLTRLEEETGSRLFERDTRQVVLTEAGRTFLEFAQTCLQRRDGLHQELAASTGLLRGSLRVFASVTACYSILPPFVTALDARYPELRLSVETGDPAEADQALAESRVDLALAALSPRSFGRNARYLVQSTPLVFVASHAHAASQGLPGPQLPDAELPPELLGRQQLIVPQKGLARERLDRWMRHHQQHPAISAEVAGNEAILALTHLGLGLGLVPRLVLENSPFANGLVQYRGGPEFGDYQLGFVLARHLPASLDAALRPLLEQAYPMGAWEENLS
jgi:LysR family positive regulator for ilvC